jgi:predicted  nucleic acid-binding Zn-ribbon protein
MEKLRPHTIAVLVHNHEEYAKAIQDKEELLVREKRQLETTRANVAAVEAAIAKLKGQLGEIAADLASERGRTRQELAEIAAEMEAA